MVLVSVMPRTLYQVAYFIAFAVFDSVVYGGDNDKRSNY
jgi:hypothetical protein